ncbi:unnamed protein product [Cyclocybe aegerita]|uniref:Uncharacterized protein n=1 Tax=Cyclocybe aegerita TaxID=1973307 RepID=A0A8S0WC86_CYCAE|nr:unnamed protein product [Cyclocybe aegerita]
MADDERAAKAARAKALLKKRQQKKAADSAVTVSSSGVASPVSPPRTFSPAPSEPVKQEERDLNEVFSKDGSDSEWLTSLPRVASPPVPPPASTNVHQLSRSPLASSPSPAAASTPPIQSASPVSSSLSDARANALEKKVEALTKENESLTAAVSRLKELEAAAQQAEASLEAERRHVEELQEDHRRLQEDTEIALENERRTVSILVSEKAHLTSEVQKLEGFESKAQTLEDLLETERAKSHNLSEQSIRLQTEVKQLSQRTEQLAVKEKELLSQNKEQERQLQIITATAIESRKEADELQRKLRELEEQIQSDDRVERLELSLKNTQDRADELEFQLTKIKQAHALLKTERDGLDSKVQELVAKELDWSSKTSALDAQVATLQEHLSTTEKERNELLSERSRLEQTSQSTAGSVKDLEDKLALAATAIANSTRQLQTAQNDLKNAIRRAEDAERTQKSLQAEGTNLMRSLDEMRPKIVELTTAKLDLSEKAESLEHAVRNRDATISQLENDLGEARSELEEAEQVWKERLAQQEKRFTDSQNGHSDMQKAYGDLQEELETALASLRNLEGQRTGQHQETARRLEEIERLTNLSQTQGEELVTLQRELEARRNAQDEEQDFLERAQNEIEALRSELSTRDEEIEQLRETVASYTSTANSPADGAGPGARSLDDELLSSLRQQHALELSAATSQIRALEDTVFEKDSAVHGLQKQLAALEEQLAHFRANGGASRLGLVHGHGGVPSRPSSALANEVRRSSFGSHRSTGGVVAPSLPGPLARSVFEQNMDPETLHKRKVSLSMLKARIDSEVKFKAANASGSNPPSRALSPVHSEGSVGGGGSGRSSVAGHRHSHSHSHGQHSHVQSQKQVHRSQFLDESHVFWCHSCQGDLVIL